MDVSGDVSGEAIRGGPRVPGVARVVLIGTPSRTTALLAAAWFAGGIDAAVLPPAAAQLELRRGDVAIFRLDVLPTLDGVEPGLEIHAALVAGGVRVLNAPDALRATHDKLRTAHALVAAGIRHPRTLHVTGTLPPADAPLPCVVKPRFGSWGTDVVRCHTQAELAGALAGAASKPWWRRHGALVQELVPGAGRDLRLLVAAGQVVGAAARVAAAGEWRTNVSVGARVEPAQPPPDAIAEAVRAAAVIGIDFAGVDLLPWAGGWVVLELNGAVDFDDRYAPAGRDLYEAIADALCLPRTPQPESASTRMQARARAETMTATPEEDAVMVKTMQGQPAKPGDVIEITGHVVGDAPRSAEILEVLGSAGTEHFRVRWEDGHESIFFPGDDAVIRRKKARS